MHTQLLVTCNRDHAETSEGARAYVADVLERDQSFVGEGGYFASSVADWFVIGGRWSGTLSAVRHGADFRAEAMRRIPPRFPIGYADDEREAHATALQALWEELGGSDRNPLCRDQYADLGYGDDAQIVDEMLYDALLAPYEGSDCDGETFLDLDWQPVSREAFVGRKWLVIVDYHS